MSPAQRDGSGVVVGDRAPGCTAGRIPSRSRGAAGRRHPRAGHCPRSSRSHRLRCGRGAGTGTGDGARGGVDRRCARRGHVLPLPAAGRVVSADPGPAQSLADALSAAGVETTHGLSWSTDAIYRETRAGVSRRVRRVPSRRDGSVRADGDRPLPLHPVRRGGDGRGLAGLPEWQHRGWMTARSARRELFASAADAAVTLTS